jgi:hypothetical protein
MATYLEYMDAAMQHAQYEWSDEDEEYHALIPELKGLWATGQTIEEAKKDLYSALDSWIYVNFWIARSPFPKFGDIDITEPPPKVDDV